MPIKIAIGTPPVYQKDIIIHLTQLAATFVRISAEVDAQLRIRIIEIYQLYISCNILRYFPLSITYI